MIPLHHIDVPLHCINTAAIIYHVPATVLMALLETENGKKGEIHFNKNGTYDIGPMQINSSWLPFLKQKGIDEQAIRFDPCTNITVGAWILATSIAKSDDVAAGIGNYHSRTPQYHQTYVKRIERYFFEIQCLSK